MTSLEISTFMSDQTFLEPLSSFSEDKHDPDQFHVALTTTVKVSTYRLVQATPTGHRVDVCFQEKNMEQFELIKELGFDFKKTLYKPIVPVPDNANIL